jgi:feruloyl esterase
MNMLSGLRPTPAVLPILIALAAGAAQAAGFDEAACTALTRSALPDGFGNGRITKAEWIGAGPYKVEMPTVAGTYTVIAHCNVDGRLNERKGVDGKPYFMGFNLRLPQDWNGRFLFQGGGGTDGVTRPALGMLPAGAQNEVPPALTRGFAVVSTDAGHQNEAGEVGSFLFGHDPQARSELGYAHLPAVSQAALATIRAVYGSAAKQRYFVGCSNGGRQGMMAAQRFPDLFDGIIAGAPAYKVPYAAAEATQQTQALAAISPKDTNGRPLLGSALSRDELGLVSKGILATCDAQDGVADGMVNDIAGCKFSPQSLRCASDADGGAGKTCLAPAKVAALEKVFAGSRRSDGSLVYSDWPWDPAIANPGWIVWRLGMNPTAMPPSAINAALIPGSMAFAFMSPPMQGLNSGLDLYDFALQFNIDRDLPRLAATSGIYKESSNDFNNPLSANLDAFTAHGGKIVFFHGMADPIFSARDTVRYIEQLRSRDGAAKVAAYSRLYLIPGMTHCRGGDSTEVFEILQPLQDWVEKGQAPDALIARGSASGRYAQRSRPLCVWPQQAFYKGSGDSEAATSFECR